MRFKIFIKVDPEILNCKIDRSTIYFVEVTFYASLLLVKKIRLKLKLKTIITLRRQNIACKVFDISHFVNYPLFIFIPKAFRFQLLFYFLGFHRIKFLRVKILRHWLS